MGSLYRTLKLRIFIEMTMEWGGLMMIQRFIGLHILETEPKMLINRRGELPFAMAVLPGRFFVMSVPDLFLGFRLVVCNSLFYFWGFVMCAARLILSQCGGVYSWLCGRSLSGCRNMLCHYWRFRILPRGLPYRLFYRFYQISDRRV